jgi:6,7-dimethyl-8-ribityllumazine synthase
MAVENFLIDSRYYKGGSLILAFCNDAESLKGLLVYGRSREEIEAKLRGAIVEILTATGAKVDSVKVERYPGVLPVDFVPGVFYGTADIERP